MIILWSNRGGKLAICGLKVPQFVMAQRYNHLEATEAIVGQMILQFFVTKAHNILTFTLARKRGLPEYGSCMSKIVPAMGTCLFV